LRLAIADRGFPYGYRSDTTIDLTWALILASARNIVAESNSMRSGGWQRTVGTELRERLSAFLALGDWVRSRQNRPRFWHGSDRWSRNMTSAAAQAAGALLVSKDELFKQADILTIHLVLSGRTSSLVGRRSLR